MHDYLTIFDSSFIAPFGDGLEEEKLWLRMVEALLAPSSFCKHFSGTSQKRNAAAKDCGKIKMAET